ncbi:hypothetical protein OG453_23650 [Streptomyces sp. NBC_01381]|uniref:hypothetical protein n=1 Tax=Streptomyces sp. NBC_01381 TaxID=2903845 RepID=UPI0022569ED2|nr:hypothetical protein [Streptomyces sp. NBC_01381]MCX4669642.1 hypothetical protein [Streptomyces sp. NBC_01381]
MDGPSKKPERRPQIGDEVEYAPGKRAVLTDVREGHPILRGAGGLEWPASDPDGLTTTRTQAQRRLDGDDL